MSTDPKADDPGEMEETTAPGMEKESLPDLVTAVKILTGSTVEIAAASVGETTLVKAVQKIEDDGKGLDFTLEVVEPEVLEVTTEVGAKEAAGDEAADEVNEEGLKSAEPDVESPAAEKLAEDETSASVAADEEAASFLSEEPTTSAPTVEEVGEVESEDQAAVPEAVSEEAVSTEASPENAAFAEDTTPAASVDVTTPAAETSVEEATVEASAEETVEAEATHSAAATIVDSTQLAAASSGSDLEVLSAAEPESTSEAPVHEVKQCHSCHSAPLAAEDVAPPAALGGQLASEEAVDITYEVKEAVSLVEGQTTETMVAMTTQS
uniref:dextranase-like n=1 Tax=Epinephelus lanceolatus TaxID=310571 RepID=UPI001444E2B0|nr:dextranase-like [Epinephelus lanceolatus]